MKFALLFILAISRLDCPVDHTAMQTQLNGKWVDIHTKTDTLTFLVVAEHDYVQLERGVELNHGVFRPKNGSGPYQYKIAQNIISLRWTLSSFADYNDHYFKQAGDTLVIGNFYDLNLKGKMQTFVKIK